MKDSKITSNAMASNLMNQFDAFSLASDFIIINPIGSFAEQPIEVSIKLKKSPGSFENSRIYRINSEYSLMTNVNSNNIQSEQVTFETAQGGVYVVKNEKNYTVLIVSLVVAGILIALVLAASLFLFKNPKYFKRLKYSACNAKRSLSSEI
jgi:hypothetical protein